MKKFFSLVAVLCASVALMADAVTYDFTTAASLQAMNITPPTTDNNGVNLSGTPITINGVTMTCVKNANTDTRIWAKTDGSYELRTYNTNTITFTASEPITTIEAKGSNVKFNELTNGNWQGSATSVTLTANATCNITRFIIHMGDSVEVWTPDTVSVTEAIALIAAGDDKTHYVKGVVASKAWVASGSYPANVTFNLVDCDTPTDTLQAYNMAKNATSAKFQNQADADSLICFGDTILVFANQLSFYAAKSLNEINGGYYVEILGKAPYQIFPFTYGDAIYHGQMPDAWEFSLVLRAADEQLPMIDLRFNSRNEHGIAGNYSTFHSVVYTTETGDPLGADNAALTISYADVSGNDYNIYNIELVCSIWGVLYRYEGQIEIAGYTEDYAENYSLADDRPYIPQPGDTLTCAQAKEYTLTVLESGAQTDFEVTVIGYITDTNGEVSRNQQVFWMDDQKGTTKTFEAYWCNVPDGVAIPVDAKVAITGKLMNYNGTTAEMKNGNTTIIEGGPVIPERELNILPVPDDAITVAEALEIGAAINNGDVTEEEYTVVGYICKVQYQTKNDSASWYMLDTQMEAEAFSDFEAYKCAIDNSIMLNDYVFVTGHITKYVGEKYTTIEISKGEAHFAEAPSAIENVTILPVELDLTQPMYNAQGQKVDATYRGIVIQNGHKYLLY